MYLIAPSPLGSILNLRDILEPKDKHSGIFHSEIYV